MPSTCQQIIDAGFAKSAAARPDTLASPAQLVDRVGQALFEFFQVMTRENPMLCGVSASVDFNGTGWPRPADSLRVLKVQADAGTIATPAIAVGDEIGVVAFDDQDFLEGSPSLTELGQSFVPTGQDVDPSNGTVTVIYARAPQRPATVNDSLDAFFPSPMFDAFLEYDMAAFLARQDQRAEDEQTFLQAKGDILSQATDWMRQQTYSLQQRFPLVSPPTTNVGGGRAQPQPE